MLNKNASESRFVRIRKTRHIAPFSPAKGLVWLALALFASLASSAAHARENDWVDVSSSAATVSEEARKAGCVDKPIVVAGETHKCYSASGNKVYFNVPGVVAGERGIVFVDRASIHTVGRRTLAYVRFGESKSEREFQFNCNGENTFSAPGMRGAFEFVCDAAREMAAKDAAVRAAENDAARGSNSKGLPPSGTTAAKDHPRTPSDRLFGSGFAVSPAGYFLTNYHVVAHCSIINVHIGGRQLVATVVGTDKRDDLALLKASIKLERFAQVRLAPPVKQGESVIAVGYPYMGLLASGPNVSAGIVNALAGLGNDLSRLQISAPLQPGNSGGPVLDSAGAVIGVAVEKLDAIRVAELTGDIPQNVNFAVKASVAVEFAKRHGVELVTTSSPQRLDAVAIADAAMAYVAIVECR